MNALSRIILERKNRDYSLIEDVDFIDQIEIREDDAVALVEYIRPFVSKIRRRANKPHIRREG